jgi:hypothetical protein
MPFVRGPMLLAALSLAAGSVAFGQNTQPVWFPPASLYGRPVAQPFFDFPVWARYCHCRPAPLTWGYDPFPNYGPVECDVCQGLESINCPGDFVCHRPSIWYSSVDAAPLQRAYSDTPIASLFIPAFPGFNQNGDGDFNDPGDIPPAPPFFSDPLFGTNNLDPPYDAAAKFTVGARVFDCFRIEGVYTTEYAWQTAATIHSNAPTLATMFSGFQIPPDGVTFAGATDVSIFGETSYQSYEANVRYWVDMPPGPFDVSILVGARYMRIDDAFRIVVADSGVVSDDVQAATENRLWGVQIGIAGDWMLHPRFWINTDLKVGVFDNQTQLAYDDGVAPPLTGAGERTAIVGDIGIVGHWQMTPHLVFNLGYQVLIVDGVATGLDSIENPPFIAGLAAPATRFDDNGQITFHGPTIGLMAVW